MDMLNKRVDQVEGDVFDILHSLGDFHEFKDLILNYKNDKMGRNIDMSGLLEISSANHLQK